MLSEIQLLKISLMTDGIEISDEAATMLRGGALSRPFVLSDYATTSGLTMKIASDVWVNAPIKPYQSNYENETSIRLERECGQLWVVSKGLKLLMEPVPMPLFHDEKDSDGTPYTSYAISHADRVRISPIEGCSFSCAFCDSYYKLPYRRKPLDAMIDGIRRAVNDPILPARHVLISGGTPKPYDYEFLNEVYRRVAQTFTSLNVDVMMVPVPGFFDPLRLHEVGIHGLAINLELYNEALAKKLMPQKASIERKHWLKVLEKSVNIFGPGKVRSLLVVGLEPLEDTLRGVEFLSQLGCEPVLSPFRPDPSTPLFDLKPPSAHFLAEAFERSIEITERYGTKLGPRCIPCQHNTLSFPDGSDYYN